MSGLYVRLRKWRGVYPWAVLANCLFCLFCLFVCLFVWWKARLMSISETQCVHFFFYYFFTIFDDYYYLKLVNWTFWWKRYATNVNIELGEPIIKNKNENQSKSTRTRALFSILPNILSTRNSSLNLSILLFIQANLNLVYSSDWMKLPIFFINFWVVVLGSPNFLFLFLNIVWRILKFIKFFNELLLSGLSIFNPNALSRRFTWWMSTSLLVKDKKWS